jgi:hypothetical protein
VVGGQAPGPNTQLTVAPPTSFALGFGPGRAAGPTTAADGSNLRYARAAVSPLPFLGVAAAAAVAAWVALHQVAPTGEEVGRPASAWFYNTSQLVAPWERIDLRVSSSTAEWVATGLLALGAVAVVAWIARVGQNVRSGAMPFGLAMPLLAFPAWWMLPLTLGSRDIGNRSFLDMLSRFSFALVILLAQFVLIRWPGLNRLWRAGRLRYDYLSMALWLPMAVPWFMFLASYTLSLASTGEDGRLADSSWLPTHNMQVWATWTSRACSIGTLVLLVVVSVIQHLGIRRDRAEDAAARAR